MHNAAGRQSRDAGAISTSDALTNALDSANAQLQQGNAQIANIKHGDFSEDSDNAQIATTTGTGTNHDYAGSTVYYAIATGHDVEGKALYWYARSFTSQDNAKKRALAGLRNSVAPSNTTVNDAQIELSGAGGYWAVEMSWWTDKQGNPGRGYAYGFAGMRSSAQEAIKVATEELIKKGGSPNYGGHSSDWWCPGQGSADWSGSDAISEGRF